METIKLPDQQPDINELVRIYAKEKGISEPAAWTILTRTWIPKAQIFETYGMPGQENHDKQVYSQPNITAELLASKQNSSMQKLELEYKLKQLEYQGKTEAREEKKLELEKERIKNEKELAIAKLELEKTIADQKIEQENRRLQSKEDFDAKLLLIQAGKKPEEAVEKFYERLFTEKKENDQSLEKLRKEHSDQLQKLENSIKNKSSPEDVFEQLEKLKKVEKGMMETTLTSLEAYGVDTKALRKVAKMEEKTTSGAIYEVGTKIWNELVKPTIDKAQKELSPPQYNQGGQIQPPLYTGPTPEQIEQQKRVEADRLRQEMTAKQKEKELLEAQIKHERQIYEQRQQLENRAIELGIPIRVDMTDRQISDLIIRQEFALEQVRAERLKLEARAMTLGIPFDDTLPSDQLFDIIEHKEAEVEQQHLRGRHAAAQHMGTVHVAENTKPLVEQVINEAVVGTQAPIPKEQTEPMTQIPQTDDELIKPPEVSKETEEFLKGIPASVTDVPAPSEIPEEKGLQEAPKKKSRKKKEQKDIPEQEKQSVTYQVIREDGEPVGDIEAKNPHGAAMKAARIIGAADAPVNIKISGGGLDKEQSYEVAMVSTERHDGKQIQVAKANRVQD